MSIPKIKSIKSAKNLKNKIVLVRCDFDLPISEKTRTKTRKNAKIKILDNSRLQACVPTIEFLLKKKVKQIILIGHLGRPASTHGRSSTRGGPKGVDKKLSLEPVKKELEKLLKKEIGDKRYELGIFFNKNVTSYQLPVTSSKLVMLENLRFSDREQKNCERFAKKLANLADIYVNEAFAVSHRSASSTDAIQNFLPSYAGLNLEQEILNMSAVLKHPKKPLTVIIGGAKIETKLPVINNFIKSADNILIGGGVANTFLKAQGMDIKNSLVNDKYINQAKFLLDNFQFPISNFQKKSKLKIKNSKIILPFDFKWSGNKIYDIGPKTIQEYSAIIKKSNTIIWNGPMGYFEDKKFRIGTEKIAQAILKNKKAKTIIGGGETNEILKNIYPPKRREKIPKNIFISTGGGAMLEFLSNKKMPGLRKIYK